MTFTNFEIDGMLERLTIIVDTREQDTPALRRRLEEMGCRTERAALPYGDYTAKTVLPDGSTYSLADKLVIERKMSVDELCACFGRGRERFGREFGRAKADGAKVILLIENGDWKKAFSGQYRSLYSPAALVASMLAWMERYGMVPQFCPAELSGRLIYKTLRYGMKERLEAGIPDECERG